MYIYTHACAYIHVYIHIYFTACEKIKAMKYIVTDFLLEYLFMNIIDVHLPKYLL